MASTYFILVVITSDEIREVNQNFVSADGDFLLVNSLVLNGVFLLVFSSATMFALGPRDMVGKYIRETRYGAHAKDERTSKKNLRKEDFVSRRVIWSVSVLVLVGSVGGARFLFFVNNLMEYFGYLGFMSLFLRTFPGVHEQLALIIVFSIATTVFYRITYLLLRLTAR